VEKLLEAGAKVNRDVEYGECQNARTDGQVGRVVAEIQCKVRASNYEMGCHGLDEDFLFVEVVWLPFLE
jgi:hypothetical protein